MSAQAARLRDLHAPGELLVVPNVWDGLSARLVEQAGARVLATSSAAVAWARGYADGERLPLDELVAVVRCLARGSRLPLTVDFERGYGRTPEQVADAVARIVDAGASGVNLEDGGGDAAELVAKLRVVRQRLGDGVFINARTCIVLHARVSAENVVTEVLARARAFSDAGADGLFVPGLVEASAIERIAAGCALPLNVMLLPGLPPLDALRRLGVRRVSVAARLAEVAYGEMLRATRALLDDGAYGALLEPALSYPAANRLFA